MTRCNPRRRYHHRLTTNTATHGNPQRTARVATHPVNGDNGTTQATPPMPPPPVQFIDAIYRPEDLIGIRPIETWTQDGQKKSRVVYTCIYYRTPKLLTSPTLWLSLVNMSARERANLFFGVCPRFGSDQQFDQAWQIRAGPLFVVRS